MDELVGLGGEKFSGKNTAAQVLIDKYGFQEHSLARPLKELCANVFDLPYENWDDPKLKERPFETPRPVTYDDVYEIVRHCSNMLNLEMGFRKSEEQVIKNMQKKVIKRTPSSSQRPTVPVLQATNTQQQGQPQQMMGLPRVEYKVFDTPRKILQFVGTDLVRDCISPYFWCKVLDNKIKFEKKVILTDVRFFEEREYVKIKNGLLIKVERDTDKQVDLTKPKDKHSSETSLGGNNEYHYLLRNNGTVDELRSTLETVYNHNRLLVADKIYKIQLTKE